MSKVFKEVLTGVLLATVLVLASISQASEPADSKLTLISNVNIFDGKNEKLLENMHVLVKDNLIETISAEPLAVIQTDNVTMVDGNPPENLDLVADAETNFMVIMKDGKIYKDTLP